MFNVFGLVLFCRCRINALSLRGLIAFLKMQRLSLVTSSEIKSRKGARNCAKASDMPHKRNISVLLSDSSFMRLAMHLGRIST